MKLVSNSLIIGAALTIVAGPAQADDRFWNNAAGGLFGEASNWDAGGGPVPGIGDVAIFDLATSYTVSFLDDQLTDRVIARHGAITFALAPESDPVDYTLLNPLASTPSIVVAEDTMAELVLQPGFSLRGESAVVGIGGGANGELAVCGGELLLNQHLHIGLEGHGRLVANDGGVIENDGAALGLLPGADGTAEIRGSNSAWDSTGSLIVGEKGTGTMTIAGGADVTSDGAVVGLQPGSLGNVSVTGLGSSWLVFDTIDIGMRGTGTLTIDDGATMFNLGFATIGSFPTEVGEGGLGIVRVEGEGSSWSVQGDLWIGFLADGTLILSRGGRVDMDGDLFRALSSAPSRLIIEIGTANDYTVPALVSGGFTDDFEPEVKLVDGYVPELGDRYEIVRAAAAVGGFAFDLPALPEGLVWHLIAETDSVALEIATPCVAFDIDESGQVDFGDVLAILASWGECPGCEVDIDFSGAADFGDVLLILANWGICP